MEVAAIREYIWLGPMPASYTGHVITSSTAAVIY